MIEKVKKALLMSIGLAFLTKEKIEETGKKIAKELEISEKDGRKLVDELLKKSEEVRHAFESQIQEHIQSALKKLNIPTRQEIDIIKRQIGAIEERITQ